MSVETASGLAAVHSSRIMPAIFVGHGLPINAALTNDYARALGQVAAKIPVPEAILVLSAHWSTPGICVTSSPLPRQMFDSIEFQQELNEINYDPPGAPELAEAICGLLRDSGFNACVNPKRGLDTSVWGVLVHMYPQATIPVVEMSLSYHIDTSKIILVGKALATLRHRGILIIGSGGLIHNIYEMSKNINTKPPAWAEEADRKIAAFIQGGDVLSLSEFTLQNLGRSPAIPTVEHILPALAILAMQEPDDHVSFFYEAFQNSTISMRSFIVGPDESYLAPKQKRT